MDLELDPLNILAGVGVTARTHTETWPAGLGALTFDEPVTAPDVDDEAWLETRFDFDVVLVDETARRAFSATQPIREPISLGGGDWAMMTSRSVALDDFLAIICGDHPFPETVSDSEAQWRSIYNEDDVLVAGVLSVTMYDYKQAPQSRV